MKIKTWTENWRDGRIKNTYIRNWILQRYRLTEQTMTGEAA